MRAEGKDCGEDCGEFADRVSLEADVGQDGSSPPSLVQPGDPPKEAKWFFGREQRISVPCRSSQRS